MYVICWQSINQAPLTWLVLRTAETAVPCVMKQKPSCVCNFLILLFSLMIQLHQNKTAQIITTGAVRSPSEILPKIQTLFYIWNSVRSTFCLCMLIRVRVQLGAAFSSSWDQCPNPDLSDLHRGLSACPILSSGKVQQTFYELLLTAQHTANSTITTKP